MDNPIIYWVIGSLLILFFFYLTYKFTDTWRALHVVFAFLVFASSLALLVYVSLALRTHNHWRSQVTQQQEALAKEEADRDAMLYGNRGEVLQTQPSVRSLNAQLRRTEIDRGRVWRGCSHAQPAPDDTVAVNTVPAGIAADAAQPNHIEQSSILYLFLEDVAPETDGLPEGARIPRFYVGEFTAAAVTDKSVTLKPTFPLDPFEKRLLRQGGPTWVLYETMPVDGHKFFAADPNAQPNWDVNADEEPVFGAMDAETLQRLMLPQRQLVASDEQFLALIEPYLRDGLRARESDPPDNVWVKVRFAQPYEQEVDTAGDAVGAIVSSETFFDREGRSEVALLRRREGEKVTFQQGDVALFPQAQQTVQQLIQDGVCELVERVFVRRLRDYKEGFREITQQLAALSLDIYQLRRDTAEATRADELVREQIKQRQEEQAKVKQDLEKFRYEQEQITQYAADLSNRWNELKQELSELYRTNGQLATQLAQLDLELTEDINRRTLEAVDRVD